MDHKTGETSVPKTAVPVPVQHEGDQVMGDTTANAGLSTGSGSSGDTNNNIDEAALQSLNVRVLTSVERQTADLFV
jgi:hypothetical protein